MAKFTKIIVNGKEVTGPEDVAGVLKQFVQDADKNGVPDFLEGFLKNPLLKMVLSKTGGDLHKALANIPPEKRAKLEEILKKLGGGSGMAGMADLFQTGGPTVTLGANDVSVASSASSSVSSSFGSSGTSFRSSTPSSGADFQIDYKKLGIPDPSGESGGSKAKVLVWVVLGLIIAAAVFWFRFYR